MKSTKMFSLVISTALIFVLGIAPATAAEKVSIADIREEVAGGWHQTYESHGRTVSVAVDVVVPDVEKVPILRVGHVALVHEEELGENRFAYALTKERRPGVFLGSTGEDDHEIAGDDARAEENPLSRQEAEEIALQLFRQFEPQTGPLDLRLSGYMAQSRVYVRDGDNGDISDLNHDKPTTEMGSYFLQYQQYLHGIPVAGTNPLVHEFDPDYKTPKAQGMNHATIATKDDFTLVITPYVEKEVILDDVPLVPFATVRSTIEKLINAGLLRDVRRIGLAYYSYFDKEKPGEQFILQPVWLLWGDYVEDASYPDNKPSEFNPEYEKKFGGTPIMVDAYTGELLGSEANWDYADLSRY